MKLSIVLSTQPASFSALSYTGKLAENLGKISRMGFDGVELAVRDPRLLDFAALEKILHQLQLPVCAIGTGQAFGEEGLSFTHPDPYIRDQAIQRILSQMELARKLNALVIIGLIRGRNVSQVGWDHAETWLSEALRQCSNRYPDIQLAIEPINRYETDFLNTVEQSLAFLDRLGIDNVGLLLDTFHMNIEEPSIAASIISAGKKLFHFHVADSNRRYPGAGHIDFPVIVETLDQTGYRRFISGEMLPLPDADTSAGKMIEMFRALVK